MKTNMLLVVYVLFWGEFIATVRVQFARLTGCNPAIAKNENIKTNATGRPFLLIGTQRIVVLAFS